jgi:hypothetical protein
MFSRTSLRDRRASKRAGWQLPSVCAAAAVRGLQGADLSYPAHVLASAKHYVADVLFGRYNPTGKLSHTWPRTMSQIPINVGPKGEKPAAAPLFEYGFGLSYK